jgi:hypothetical protein
MEETMAESVLRESARIYQFPIRDRAVKVGPREGQKIADIASSRVPSTDFGSGWYHEAAVQEAELARWRQPR